MDGQGSNVMSLPQGKHQAPFLLKEEQASHGQILLVRQEESLLLA